MAIHHARRSRLYPNSDHRTAHRLRGHDDRLGAQGLARANALSAIASFLISRIKKPAACQLDIRNTSDQALDLTGPIVQALQQRGYTVTADPRSAFYLLQGNIRYVGQADPSALRQTLTAGYGGPVLGAAIGALAGRDVLGVGVGALTGTALELVAGTLVKDVTYTLVTDLQIAERTASAVQQSVASHLTQGTSSEVEEHSHSTRDRRRYQTRLVATANTANQVNLTFDEARGPFTGALATSIAGIF